MMRGRMPESARDGWHIAVVIPACNEESLLPACLRSVARACALLPEGVTWDVVVVCDSCTDRTLELAQASFVTEGAVLAVEEHCVGNARAVASETAMRRSPVPASRCWLANTDADCEVPATWLLEHLRIAREGYVAAAGIVDVADFSEHDGQVAGLFRTTYRIERDGTHPHVHGANLGVRADAYRRAGGWAALATGEDHALWSRLRMGGGPLLNHARLCVLTSGRRTGRAPLGFAAALAAHNAQVPA